MTVTTATLADLGIGGDYPTSWQQFVGQESAKHLLQTACRSAKMRNAPLDHVLIASGVPGVGKTALGILCALEMGRGIKVVSNKINADQARMLLSDMQDGDVLFIDEIHLLVQGGKASAEQWLLHLMENATILGPLGPEECPHVTIIGATTDEGRLPETILSRFVIRPTIRAYSEDEAASIACGMATRLFPEGNPIPTLDNLLAIARAGNRNPRVMRSILINLRDIAVVTNGANWRGYETGGYDITESLEALGLTEDGLDLTARRYLHALLKDFPAGAGALAIKDRLQAPGGLGYVERVLVEKALIGKTKRGRVLSAAGIKRAKQFTSEDVA